MAAQREMKTDSRQIDLRGRALVATVAALLVAPLVVPPLASGDVELERRPISIERKNLFDLGVADYDRDGRSDLFTTNHSQTSSLLRNLGRGRFDEQIYASGLDHQPQFPGLADLTAKPALSRPGLYIYPRPEGRYEVRRVGRFGAGVELTGTLRFRTYVELVDRDEAAVVLSRNRAADPPVTRVEFALPADGSSLLLDTSFLDVPVGVEIGSSVPLGQVFVGSRAVTPRDRRFELRLPDRHGIAIADLNGDGLRDAWVVSGGGKGRIGKFEGLIEDELFINTGAGFVERRRALGIEKGVCRGRTADTVDFDGDGLLDLFSSCAEDEPKLYRQRVDGGFEDVSAALTRGNPTRGSEYRWADLHGGRGPELLVARSSSFAVLGYDRRSGSFERIYRIRREPGGSVRRLLVADFDNDGDQDVFAASPAGNVLLRRRGARLRPIDPDRLGLPARSAAASWVDFDNDGRTDLHALPGGLFRQRSDGSFAATGLATVPAAGRIYAPSLWFDLENDGDRDLIVAYKRSGRLARAVQLRRSRGSRNRWLHVDLTGSGRNTDAIGARVRLRAGGRRLTGWVGQSDSARHSRGDHRVYFGLGRKRRVARLVVTWPDGERTVLRDVRTNRVLSIVQ